MKKIIEFFTWQHEGNYNQYFFIVDSDQEEQFFKDLKKHLTLKTKEEFPWSEPLYYFKQEQQVEIEFGNNSHINHLATIYYIEFNYGLGFKIIKQKWE